MDDRHSAALEIAIEHAREESKLIDARRQRWDGAAVGLVTGATALGALLVTAARSLTAESVEEWAAAAVFVTLALTILAAVVSRITGLMRVRRKHRLAKREEKAAARAVEALLDGATRDAARLQLAILRRWTTRARCGVSSLRWQRACLVVSAVALTISIGILGIIARSALDDVWT